MNLGNKRGIFPWYSLTSTNPGKAVEFYKKLFGWTTEEFEIPDLGKTTLLANQGMQFCDVSPPPKGAKNTHSYWSNYIAVDDVDACLEQIERYGGKILQPAFDMPTIGRSALATDPFGAHFMPFTPEKPEEMQSAMGTKEGSICWNELLVNDPKQAMTFYSEVCGWKFKEGKATSDYYEIHVGDTTVGGVMKTPPQASNMPPAWMVYLATQDIAAKMKDAERFGGRMVMPATKIPHVGTFALMEDPTGCMAYLFQFN